jgi:hypothetical protein
MAVAPFSQRETVSGVVPIAFAKSAPDHPSSFRRKRISSGVSRERLAIRTPAMRPWSSSMRGIAISYSSHSAQRDTSMFFRVTPGRPEKSYFTSSRFVVTDPPHSMHFIVGTSTSGSFTRAIGLPYIKRLDEHTVSQD